MKLSIIVPVYNAEAYLCRCLDSLLDQGFGEEDYEIICINDGSTDRSLEICEEYSQDHKQIKVITQDNQGVSAARNAGLDIAAGDMVCFVDSDDVIVANGLSDVLNCLEDGVDLVRFWCKFVIGSEDDVQYEGGNSYYHGDGLGFILKYGLCTFAVSYLYRKSFLDSHLLRFQHVKMAEDLLFVSTVLMNNPRMIATSFTIYYYYINPLSATTNRSKSHSKQCVNDMIRVFTELLEMSKSFNLDDDIKLRVQETLYGRTYNVVSRMMTADYTKNEYVNVVDKLRALCAVPIPASYSYGIKRKAINMVINSICESYLVYKSISYLYRHLFIPYVMPNIDRNK